MGRQIRARDQVRRGKGLAGRGRRVVLIGPSKAARRRGLSIRKTVSRAPRKAGPMAITGRVCMTNGCMNASAANTPVKNADASMNIGNTPVKNADANMNIGNRCMSSACMSGRPASSITRNVLRRASITKSSVHNGNKSVMPGGLSMHRASKAARVIEMPRARCARTCGVQARAYMVGPTAARF